MVEALTCRHAGVCGGCSLLHLTYPEQLVRKEAALRRLLADSVPRRAWPPGSLFLREHADEAVAAAPAHFRQKVAFVFAPGPTGRGLVMGHYQRGSQRIVPVEECPAHSERGNRIAFALRDHLARAHITAAGPGLNGILRHLIVRTTADDREAVAMLVVTRNDKSLRRPVRAFLESPDAPDGFFVNVHGAPGPFMVGDETIRIAGHSHVRESVGDVSYLVSPTAFFQTNVHAAQLVQQAVVTSMRGATRVLDLYCGSGLFALPLAKAGAVVTGVEENRQAVRDAEANARLNRVPSSRARFLAGRSEELLRSLSKEGWDGVVLDPPRQGCAPAVLDQVFRAIAPPRATYVSCNPEALAVELPTILRAGYCVASVRGIDMFPHTEHLEAILTLTRSGAGRSKGS
jgi:23S rRNA (uracil1939-C5)-methyltransferase